MKSKVYFAAVAGRETESSVSDKVRALADRCGVSSMVHAGDTVVLKLHFGEEGNTGYVRPAYVARIAEAVRSTGGSPVVADTNTLYRGRRMNSSDHVRLAYEHGFTPDAVHAQILVPDDTVPENISIVPLGGEYVATAKIGRVFRDAAAMIGIAHFKGHLMTGFGGALKNIGMGCATREGKLFQHSDVSPIVGIKKCTGCKACVAVCPAGALAMKNGRCEIDVSKCIGCASCIAACQFNAIDLSWDAGGRSIQEKMVEYAKAALIGKEKKSMFFNFLLKITKECDCLAKDDPRIVPDIGILASADPVAIDQAAFDLVTEKAGSDILKQLHPRRDAEKQLVHAAKIGLGSREYEMETVA